ncbi:MAG: hypothetical protein AUK46_10810 [Flavobacteriaceae bacterium CG2_30_31_66]|nr:MAG: hypothetical protein AUK46_10810 [Flavobacteriaceae bacterium CG2_30_31_66]PJC09657.1 MAG: hypothetical protein CO067_09120 [Flavobacteriaceae bacterium CG_4_9_14_0_8_um_filter_31_91]
MKKAAMANKNLNFICLYLMLFLTAKLFCYSQTNVTLKLLYSYFTHTKKTNTQSIFYKIIIRFLLRMVH